MFKIGDKVQFSKFGARGLTGFVRDIQPGKVKVQWNPRDIEWVRAGDLVKLDNVARWGMSKDSGVIKLSPKMRTIHLDGDKDRKDVESAFDEIYERLFHIDGPFFMMDFGNDGVVTMELKPFSGKIRLSFITVPDKYRGKGLASKALKILTDIADRHGVAISLGVQPPRQEGGLPKKKLVEWYKRHGFDIPNSLLPLEMEREPSGMNRQIKGGMVMAASDIIATGDIVNVATSRGWRQMVVTNLRSKRTGGWEAWLSLVEGGSFYRLRLFDNTYERNSRVIRFVKKGEKKIVEQRRTEHIQHTMDIQDSKYNTAEEGRNRIEELKIEPGDKVEVQYTNGNRIETVVSVNMQTGKVGVKRFRGVQREPDPLDEVMQMIMKKRVPRDVRWISGKFIGKVVEKGAKMKMRGSDIASQITRLAKEVLAGIGNDVFTEQRPIKMRPEGGSTMNSLFNARAIKDAGYQFLNGTMDFDKNHADYRFIVAFKRGNELAYHTFTGVNFGYGGEGPHGLVEFGKIFGLGLNPDKVFDTDRGGLPESGTVDISFFM